jgi:D-alanine transaminase
MPTCYLNGEYVQADKAKISVTDRGFIFGDGVYEVTRVIEGRVFEWDRHAARLERGLAALQIDFTEIDSLLSIHERLLDDNNLTSGEATVYLQITRGAAPRAHGFPANITPTVYLTASRFAPPHEMRARGASAITLPEIRWSRCDLKTVNLLGSVLAKQRAIEAGALEALFIRDGALTEGSHTNVFGVLDGELRTYPASNYILPGITRDVVLELADELDIRVRETPIFAEELGELEELFLTGTTNDVMPIVRLDGHTVADGMPGPITMQLYTALEAKMAEGAMSP